MRTIITFIIITSLLGCERTTDSKEENTPMIIETVEVISKEISPEYKIFGTVVAGEKARISSWVNGEIHTIHAAVGEEVIKTEPLAHINSLTYRNALRDAGANRELAKARLKIAEAELRKAEEDTERRLWEKEILKTDLNQKKSEKERTAEIYVKKSELFKAGGLSEESLSAFQASAEKAESEYEKTEHMLRIKEIGIIPRFIEQRKLKVPEDPTKRNAMYIRINTESQIARVREAEAALLRAEAAYARAEMNLEKCTIRSPVTGIVASISADIGVMAAPGETLFTVFKTGPGAIEAEVPIIQLSQLTPGHPVYYSFSKMDTPEEDRYAGVIQYITPFLDPSSQTGVIRCAPKTAPPSLIPGVYVDLFIPLGEKKFYKLLPENSVLEDTDNTGLIYLVKNSRLFPRKIKPEFKREGYYAVQGELSPGDLIWKNPLPGFSAGTEVEVFQ